MSLRPALLSASLDCRPTVPIRTIRFQCCEDCCIRVRAESVRWNVEVRNQYNMFTNSFVCWLICVYQNRRTRTYISTIDIIYESMWGFRCDASEYLSVGLLVVQCEQLLIVCHWWIEWQTHNSSKFIGLSDNDRDINDE
jgi:hypothetical protein